MSVRSLGPGIINCACISGILPLLPITHSFSLGNCTLVVMGQSISYQTPNFRTSPTFPLTFVVCTPFLDLRVSQIEASFYQPPKSGARPRFVKGRYQSENNGLLLCSITTSRPSFGGGHPCTLTGVRNELPATHAVKNDMFSTTGSCQIFFYLV